MIKSGNIEGIMVLVNQTSITDRDILSIAQWVGIDTNGPFKLWVEVQANMIDHGAHFCTIDDSGVNFHLIKLKRDGDIPTLAHELRHVYQGEILGPAVFNALYEIESSIEGYKGNVFEVDARDYEGEAA